MVEPAFCQHLHTRLIARDQDAHFVECLECGALLDVDEMTEPSGFSESLSDA